MSILCTKRAACTVVCHVVSFLLQTKSDRFRPQVFRLLFSGFSIVFLFSIYLSLSLSLSLADQRADCILPAEKKVGRLHLLGEYSVMKNMLVCLALRFITSYR